MKWHITLSQYEELSGPQTRLADSYIRSHTGLNGREYYECWDIGTMIEYLDVVIFEKIIKGERENIFNSGGFIDIYGFNISGTAKDEWCDKLWQKTKLELEENNRNSLNPFT